MKICEFIELLKDCDKKLLCDVDLSLHDFAREQAHNCLFHAIIYLSANDSDSCG